MLQLRKDLHRRAKIFRPKKYPQKENKVKGKEPARESPKGMFRGLGFPAEEPMDSKGQAV
jgi:hypothetical protein